MISPTASPDFSNLLPTIDAKNLLHRLNELQSQKTNPTEQSINLEADASLKKLSLQWQYLSNNYLIHSAKDIIEPIKVCEFIQNSLTDLNLQNELSFEGIEQALTDWLIDLFNHLFISKQVILVRSTGEPEYFPAQNNQPARIEFAHGFFASALHEISHFCMAGERRRQLPDFGYWYAPDGRSAAQQQAFERVEVKPQAIECLFTLACGRPFQVSQDNLFADFDTSGSTFAQDVYQQVQTYITKPDTLPSDAKTLLQALLNICAVS
ncbi:MAG: elongation factor P hydroxylase [Psychrobacter cryohalolentis]